jgi:predicted PurR-regulated permease PerM
MALGFYVLFPFLKILVITVILVIMFYPIHQRFLKWTRQRKGLSAFLSVASVTILIILPLAIIITLVTAQVASVVNNLTINISKPHLTDLMTYGQEKISFFLAKWEYEFNLNLEIVPVIQRALSHIASFIATYSPQLVAGTANLLFSFFIMLIAMFFLFRDGDNFFLALMRISPVKDQYERRLAAEIRHTIYGVFYGSFLTGLVQATLATIGFYIAGVEGPIVWGVITFFVSFIPIIGTAGVIVPLVLILLLTGNVWQGVFLAVYGAIVIGLADNLLKPILIHSNMHPLVLFLSIFGGMAVFGPSGLLIGPIIMALLTATLSIYEKDFANHAS